MFEFETWNITKPWPSATSSHSGCSTGVSGTSRKVTASRYSGCLACPPCSASSHRPFFWLEMPEQIGRTLCRHMSPYIAVIMILHKSHCDTYFVRSFCVLTIIRQRLYPISVKLANLVHWPYIIHNPIEISTWAPSASIWVALWIQEMLPATQWVTLHISALLCSQWLSTCWTKTAFSFDSFGSFGSFGFGSGISGSLHFAVTTVTGSSPSVRPSFFAPYQRKCGNWSSHVATKDHGSPALVHESTAKVATKRAFLGCAWVFSCPHPAKT